MKRTTLLLVFLAAALLFVWGCERNVTNTIVQDDSPTGADQCMTCHTDNDLALVAASAQWANSKHGIGETSIINANIGDGGCQGCHTAEGFLANVAGIPSDSSHFSSIGCFTCHAPHTTGTLGLRITDPYTLLNGEGFDKGNANLCAQCHHSRRNVNTYVADSVRFSVNYGPHYSNQSDMLSGTGGYEYAGYTYRTSPHINVTLEGCIDCHMSPSIGVVLGGHTWTMEAETVEGEMKNTVGCNTPNCHNGGLEETFNYDGYVDSVQVLFDALRLELFAQGLLQYRSAPDDPVTHDDSVMVPTDRLIVKSKDSTGAVFNYRYIYQDGSLGVHNSKYAIDLLQSSYNFITTGDPNTPPSSAPFRREPIAVSEK